MIAVLRTQVARWLNRRLVNESPPVRLTQRRIYILPTKAGLLFGSTVLVMLLGAINYNLSLGFVLVFLLSGLGIASMLHTYRVLANLSLRPGKSEAVFAGEIGSLGILIHNPSRVPRHNLQCGIQGGGSTVIDAAALMESLASVPVTTTHRGVFRFPRCVVSSTYPLGVFRAWSYAHLGHELVVYPKAESAGPPPPLHAVHTLDGAQGESGQEDFAGLRRYQEGDSLKQIAWKALAHGHPLMSKQFAGGATVELQLRWEDTPPALGTEARLARLCRWVLEASRTGVPYSLDLPNQHIAQASGSAHDTRCLTALTLHD